MKVGLFSLALLALPAFQMESMQSRGFWKIERAAREIGLQEQQVEQIQQIFLDHRRSMIDLRADLEKKRLDLDVMLENDATIDDSRVMAQLDLLQGAHTKLAKTGLMAMLKVRKLLTKEQWERLQDLVQENREESGLWHGMNWGRRGGALARPPRPPQPPTPPRTPEPPSPPDAPDGIL